LNNILQIVESSTEAVTQLNVSGGFVNSISWMKLLADVTGKNVCVIQTYDASATGAAMLGMIGMEMIEDYASVRPDSFDIIKPDGNNHETYKKFFDLYKELYHCLKEPMHQLHNISY
jgi:gluconokinase